ncbi:MAG TPA: glycosyltransferase [Candidatus Sulfotelmatobacter sp.]|nr:glycosyltransferase [Candidatus Sulfotelmatobacter sp.]
MLTVAYLANQFPSPVESYVGDEIAELRRRGIHVVAGTVQRPAANERQPEIVVQDALSATILVRAVALCVLRWTRIADLVWRVLCRGKEGPVQRAKALAHTMLGACYAVLLGDRSIDHIHVHHGYYGAWVGMVAARLRGVDFSLTLHGSDLLLHGTYLDAKLKNCRFCLTVSEFNRQTILRKFAGTRAEKIIVSRLGVDVRADRTPRPVAPAEGRGPFQILAVGRLHSVKDHAFLVWACADLYRRGISFECAIAGEGPERHRLESMIRMYGMGKRVRLLGHVPHSRLDSLYENADLVVLTSRSEGVPLVLMEAMAHGKIVLAPAITGIPELVINGKTGFLYECGSLSDFVDRLLGIRSLLAHALGHSEPSANVRPQTLDWIRHAARVQVQHNFNRQKNLESFGDLFLARIPPEKKIPRHAHLVLQQI